MWVHPLVLRDLTVNWREHGASGPRRGARPLGHRGETTWPGYRRPGAAGQDRSSPRPLAPPDVCGGSRRLWRGLGTYRVPDPSLHSALYKYSGGICIRFWEIGRTNWEPEIHKSPRGSHTPPAAGRRAVWTISVWFKVLAVLDGGNWEGELQGGVWTERGLGVPRMRWAGKAVWGPRLRALGKNPDTFLHKVGLLGDGWSLFAIISTAASEWIKGLLLIIFPQQMVV